MVALLSHLISYLIQVCAITSTTFLVLSENQVSQVSKGRLLIVYDYMEHGTGDVMTVDSYTDVANQMDYEDIPDLHCSKS